MTNGTVYVIGAGLAGLAAAVELAARGARVIVSEAAPQAGGRCRSWHDAQFGEVIDNGNHLILSGNRSTFSYLETIGASHSVAGPDDARFAFCDVRTNKFWTISPNEGPLPWWVFSRHRRVPDTEPLDYVKLALSLLKRRGACVKDVVACEGTLWERLMRPLLLAALNCAPEDASAELAGAILRETLARGGRHCLPRIASPNLAAAFVEPALAFLNGNGANVRLGERLRGIELTDSAVTSLDFGESRTSLTANDIAILAVPPWIVTALLPGIVVPDESSAIVNAHYHVQAPLEEPAMLGVIGGTVEWIFNFPNRISVTVSGADDIVDRERGELAELLWHDVATALRLPPALPPWQIVKEKRATFRATPDQVAKRPASRTRWRNLLLAGDWTDTGLPATIEGAVRSGQRAARLAMEKNSGRARFVR